MRFLLVLLLTLLFGAPLVLVGVEIRVDPDSSRTFRELLRVQHDLFTAGKAFWVVGIASLLLVGLVFLLCQCGFRQRWRFQRGWLHPGIGFAALYFFWVLVCQFLSPYPEVSWLGFLQHYDGTLSHLAYGVIFAASLRIAVAQGKIPGLLGVLVGSSVVVLILGWMQYFGVPIWGFSLFRELFDPLWEQGIQISSKWGAGAWTSTLNAENWAGAWLALHVPFAGALVMTSVMNSHAQLSPLRLRFLSPFSRRTVLLLIWYVLLCLSLAANGTRSAWVGSLFGLCVALFLVFWAAFRRKLRPPRVASGAWVGVLLLALFFFAAQGVPSKGVIPAGRLTETAVETVAHLEQTVVTLQEQPAEESEEQEQLVESTSRMEEERGFLPADLGLRLESRGHALLLSGIGLAGADLTFLPAAAPDGLSLAVWRRQNGQSRPVQLEVVEGEGFRLGEDDLQDVRIALTQIPSVYALRLQGFSLNLFVSGSEVGIWQWGRAVQAVVPPVALHALPDHFANLRGYIWKRSVPLVLERPFFGTGAGSFPEAFPQADFSGKLKFFGMPHIIVEKPHSLYFGNLLYFGWPGLIFFMGLLGSVVVQVWGAMRKGRLSEQAVAAVSGASALLLSGAFVDSFVGFSSLFWAFLGLSFGAALRESRVTRLQKASALRV